MNYTEIQSFEDACQASGYNTNVPDVSMIPEHLRKHVIGFYKLIVETEAINRDPEEENNPKPINERTWKPFYGDGSPKFTNYFDLSGPSGFSFLAYDCWNATSASSAGSRLEHRDRDRARHAAKYFLEDYRAMIVIE